MLKKFSLFIQQWPFKKRTNYPTRVKSIQGTDYLVRAMKREDIKALLQVERHVYAGEVPWTRAAFLSELLSSVPHLYLCLEYGGELVGFIGCRVTGNDGHITNIAILPTYQGRGLGTFLLEEIESYARKQRCEILSLEVRLGNRDAQRLYRKFGFVSRTIKNGYYDETNEDALDMVKYINE
ncbi:ribosomal protein S18-alanine N-acetyltransferase [Enterococcus massiliensis]|uniref:ribosomal protein S18-alanine N-acetyltransferase n=1 Tax=Enterococcus massiliensis TaxID=1640685 RepID=UPI00065E172C|nr:ribosomal protein S18-alanine N-acetyltransferase [Enterococcus massiliensis]